MAQRFDAWADDRKWALDLEIKPLDTESAAARKASSGLAIRADKVAALTRVAVPSNPSGFASAVSCSRP